MPMGVPSCLRFTRYRPESECLVTRDWPLQQVVAGIVERPDAFVADELEERGLIQQPKYEFSVVEGKPAQCQAWCFDHRHASASRVAECSRPARVPRR